MQIDHQRAALRYQNKVNNAQGHFFEQAIKAACALYASHGRATADKTPEPFRVLEKSRDGIFKGRFTARAQPDFYGKAEIRFVRGRLRFTDEEGKAYAPAPFPSMVVIYNGKRR